MKKYSPSNLPPGFTEFWKHYPKKVGKGQAIRAWVANDCEEIWEDIVKATRRYPFSEDKQYIKHPSTWINSWAWEDTFEEEDSGNDW